VAWHLKGFKAEPLMVSRVGRDEQGQEILDRMEAWGMDRSGIQEDSRHPTGRVTALLEDGEPRFHIEPMQAYDFISVARLPSRKALSGGHLLYHGTLGLRGPASFEALSRLRAVPGTERLVDVNLRDPWWTRERVAWCLDRVGWAKLNSDEVAVLTERPVDTAERLHHAARELRDRHGIENLVVTRGEEGALGMGSGQEVLWEEAAPVGDLKDTVGAGDGFSAVVALGIHHEWSLGDTLRRAVAFAADLCGIRGATTEDEDLYRRHQRRWSHA
jgi:fructokinase